MIRRARRVDVGQQAAPPSRDRWLLSFADFLTLMLALFVVLYASAQLDSERNRNLMEGLRSAFVIDENMPPLTPIGGHDSNIQPVPEIVPAPITPQNQLKEDLARELEVQKQRSGRDHGASLYETERGIVISLASAEFFPAGGVEIPPERKAILAALAPLLAANSMPLSFEGHTDDQPIQSDRYPSNWELSSARAASVARFFIEEHGIDPHRVATVGYAEFRPFVDNDGSANRSLNRRVEIVILRDAQLVPLEAGREETDAELNRLLEGLPPIADDADESLRPPDPGPGAPSTNLPPP